MIRVLGEGVNDGVTDDLILLHLVSCVGFTFIGKRS